MSKKRILTGDRPTGRLHLGHYVGTLENRVRLQDDYECFFIIADLHVLTTRTENLHEIGENVRQLVLDYLSVGIDPEKSTVYLQSLVPEVTELCLLFSMLISVPRLQRVPTLKEVMRDLKLETASCGLLLYPVLQAADILMVRAHLVPVGKDQASHVEVTREIARRFNTLYGQVFPEPEAMIGRVPTLIGLDGKKMSKSLGNALFLSDDAKTITGKIASMFTDPTKIHLNDPGHPRTCPVYSYHRAFNRRSEAISEIRKTCLAGERGCVRCKRELAMAINEFLDPIRERRASYEKRPELVNEIVLAGSMRARSEAQQTLQLAKESMGLTYFR
jgi:tryptophanyl-tRNA synthetase